MRDTPLPLGAPRLVDRSDASGCRINARHCRELYEAETDPEHRRRLADCIAAYRAQAERQETAAAASAPPER